MVYCYTARKMTGVRRDVLVKLAKIARKKLGLRKIKVLDPVLSEGIRISRKPLNHPINKLRKCWYRDKAMIRKSHVLLDLTGHEKSEGVSHEIGYARYFLWKPVVRIYPNLGPSVARFEDDFIAGSIDEAADLITEKFGTWRKRIKWRLSLLNRCLPRFVWFQLKELLH